MRKFSCDDGTYYLIGTESRSFLQLRMHFFVDLTACLNGEWSNLSKQEFCDGNIQTCPMQTLATLVLALLDILFLTAVFGVETLALLDLMVAHRHPIATASTDHQSLQQSWSFSGRAVATIFSVRLAIGT